MSAMKMYLILVFLSILTFFLSLYLYDKYFPVQKFDSAFIDLKPQKESSEYFKVFVSSDYKVEEIKIS